MRQSWVCLVTAVVTGLVACTASEPVGSAGPAGGATPAATGSGSGEASGSSAAAPAAAVVAPTAPPAAPATPAVANAPGDTASAETIRAPERPETPAESLIGTAWRTNSETLPFRYFVFADQLVLTGLAEGEQKVWTVDYSELLPLCLGVSPCVVMANADGEPSVLHFRATTPDRMNPVQCVRWTDEGSGAPPPSDEQLRETSGLEVALRSGDVLCVYKPGDEYVLAGGEAQAPGGADAAPSR